MRNEFRNSEFNTVNDFVVIVGDGLYIVDGTIEDDEITFDTVLNKEGTLSNYTIEEKNK